MKLFSRILSYVIAFLLGAIAVLLLIRQVGMPMSKLDQLELLISQRFIGEVNTTEMEDMAAAGMIASLGDRWSYYVPAKNYAQLMEQQDNAYVGIGIVIVADPEGRGFTIESVQKGSPAEQVGILVDDIIIQADGQSAAEMTMEELRNIVRGKEGTSVSLVVLRGAEELAFDVTRAQIMTEVVASQMLTDTIGYVKIANFDTRCAAESIAAIQSLQAQGAQAMIFDVRNNGGGFAHELVQLLDYLLPEGTLFHSIDYSGKESIDISDAAYLDMPIAVLCNENSISAAEFFAAAIQEYGAGTILGTPTIGKGYFQTVFPLLDGSAVGLSIGKYVTPNGVSLAGTGIQPDITVEVDEETYANIYYSRLAPTEDPQILAAIEVLEGA